MMVITNQAGSVSAAGNARQNNHRQRGQHKIPTVAAVKITPVWMV
jgi:hypothetical protein